METWLLLTLWTALLAALFVAARVYLRRYYARMYWEWDNGEDELRAERKRIETDYTAMSFPRDFLWGTSTAAHQVEGHHTSNNWTQWESEKGRIVTGEKSGAACDHWNRYEQDIGLMRELGCNAYRFSLSWDKLQPEEGKWDKGAVRHYHDELDALRRSGIEPMITLHHFTQPLWFDRKGGFEREENVATFVAFCERVFDEYASKCRYWCTINEPEVYVAGGWLKGGFPPGKDDVAMAGRVLYHLMLAHVRVYRALKAKQQYAAHGVQIGLVKNVFQMDPYNPLNPLDVYVARVVDGAFNGTILDYLRTGSYRFSMPGIKTFAPPPDRDAPNCYDFMGLNYYSHFLVQFFPSKGQAFRLRHPKGAVMTDMPHTIYPEGLYRAIVRVARVRRNVPVIVTENGIADAADDRRQFYIRRYLAAAHRALREGINLRGYFYWSLLDNFEWAQGYKMRFGLYEVNFETQERRLRDGAKFFRDAIHYWQGKRARVE
jgi:beta-glucosidase